MCWKNWTRKIKENRQNLEKYYTFKDSPNSTKCWWNFNFKGRSSRGKYIIQVHRQPDCIYVYFEKPTGEKRSALQNETEEERSALRKKIENKRIKLRKKIIGNLEQLIQDNIKDKRWDFGLAGAGKSLGKGKIKYKIVNKNLTPIDDHQKMIDIMILIAENLQAIETGGRSL